MRGATWQTRRQAVLGAAVLGLFVQGAVAATYTVTTTADSGAGSLRDAITQANAASSGTIVFAGTATGTITLLTPLPVVAFAGSITGTASTTVSGNSLYRPFFLDPGTGKSFTLASVTIANGSAKGGKGGNGVYGGGGGLGAGGAVFVNSGNVTLSGVLTSNSSAVGGHGGNYDPSKHGGGGGGGLGGNGGLSGQWGGGGGGGFLGNGGAGDAGTGPFAGNPAGAGGGGGGQYFNGGNAVGVAGGGGGGSTAAGANASGNTGGAGGSGGGGKGGDYTSESTPANGVNGTAGGGGGGGGDGLISPSRPGGNGGAGGRFGGGGGGNVNGDGGAGGEFGGGGGGAAPGPSQWGLPGNGGFGGGGGGSNAAGGIGGFGGGGGGTDAGVSAGAGGNYGGQGGRDRYNVGSAGGGGAALGGVVFVRTDNNASLTLADSSLDAGTVTAGVPGTPAVFDGADSLRAQFGSALGSSMFLLGGNTTFSVSAGNTRTVAGSIADASAIGSAGSVTKTGAGILVLSGGNSYAGGTTIAGGAITADSNFGAGPVTLAGGGLAAAANATYSQSATIAAAGGTIDTQSFSATFSGTFSGSGALTKVGAGTLKLTGASSYTGGTVVAAGLLTADSVLPAGSTLTLAGGGVLYTSASFARNLTLAAPGGSLDTGGFNPTYSNTITGSGTFTKAGAGTLVFTGTHSASGGVTVAAGTLQVGADSAAGSITGPVTNNATLAFNRSDNTTFSYPISGTGSLVKNDASTLTLAAASTYAGATVINAGTLRLAPTAAVPAGYAAYYSFDNITGSTVKNGGSLGTANDATVGGTGAVVAGGVSGNALSFPSTTAVLTPNQAIPIGSSGGLRASTFSAWFNGLYDPNTLRVLVANGSTDRQALLRNAAGYVLGDVVNGTAHNTNVDLGAYATGWHMLTVTENEGPFNKTFYIDGQAVATFTNTFEYSAYTAIGNVVGGGQPFAQQLDEIYVYNQTLSAAQVLQLYSSTATKGALSASTPVSLTASGATLDLSGNAQTIGSLTGVAGSSVVLGTGGSLTVGSANTSTTFAGTLQGSGSLVKIGTGTLTLSGANAFSAGTTVTGGTLTLANLGALGTGPLTVQSSASVKLSPTLAGTLTLPSLTIQSTGSLDLANTTLSLTSFSLPTLRQYLFNQQLVSSTADATHALTYTAAGQVLLAVIGDANLDGKINADDYARLDRGFAKQLSAWSDGDFNYDGQVTSADYLKIDMTLALSQGGHLAPDFLATREAQFGSDYVSELLIAIPEPSALGLLLLSPFLTRRRRG